MTTRPVAQPADIGLEQDTPGDDPESTPSASDDRVVTVAAVVLVLLLALGARIYLLLNRSRSENSGKAPPSTPHSEIRIAAAPSSVVHVVSAPCLGRSHVQVPTRVPASSSPTPRFRPQSAAAPFFRTRPGKPSTAIACGRTRQTRRNGTR